MADDLADLNCVEAIQVLASKWGYRLPDVTPAGRMRYRDDAGNWLCGECATESIREEMAEPILHAELAPDSWFCTFCAVDEPAERSYSLVVTDECSTLRVSGEVDGLSGWARVDIEGDDEGCRLTVLGSDYGPGHAGVPLTWEEAQVLATFLLRARS